MHFLLEPVAKSPQGAGHQQKSTPANEQKTGEIGGNSVLGKIKPGFIPGNGSTINHFTYVEDLARAYLSAAGKRQTLGQAYNIAGAEAITIDGYVDTIAQIVGTRAQKLYLEPDVVGKLERPVFPFAWERNSLFGIQKAKDDFGFWPQYSLKSGLEDTYRWWLAERGLDKISFIPGKLGHDVDLAYEDEVIREQG